MTPSTRPGAAATTAATTPDRLDRPPAGDLLRELFPRLATGVRWDLDRTRHALADLGDPHRRYPSIHVGGTNGKGSVAATLHAVLDSASGVGRLRSGLYTSPHLCSASERFRIGGGPVDGEALARYAAEVRGVVETRGLTFFEALTVLAFHLFAREGAEVVVAEVGLGGRLDATNVLVPVVAAITNVALDHAEYLGDTLAEIAREKAGIIEAGVPVVTAEGDPEIVSLLRGVAAERGAPFRRVDPSGDPTDVELAHDHTSFTLRTRAWGTLRLRTPLVGRHQAVNAALAVAVLEELPPELRPDARAVVRGVASVEWPGRDQVERIDGGTWLFDVAHNTAGMVSLVDTLDLLDLPRPRVALLGVLGDKDWRAMLPPLLRRCRAAVLTVPPTAPEGRSWDPAAVARELEEAGAGVAVGDPGEGSRQCRLHVVEDFGEALALARSLAGHPSSETVADAGVEGGATPGGTVVATGSVYTVGHALTLLGRPPWARRGR